MKLKIAGAIYALFTIVALLLLALAPLEGGTGGFLMVAVGAVVYLIGRDIKHMLR